MRPYPFVLGLILLLSGATDSLRRVSVGPLTLQGVMTIILGVGTLGLVMTRGKLPKFAWTVIPLVVFLVVGGLSCYVNLPISQIPFKDQTQGLLVYALFVGTMLLSAGEAYRSPVEPPWYLSEGFTKSAQLSMALYGFGILTEGPGSSGIMGPRSFAIYAIVAAGWLLACAKHKAFKGASWMAVGLTVLVAFSFSRTATVICLLLYPLSQISPRDSKSWLRVGATMGFIGLIAYLTFTYVEPIRNRFTDVGDSGSIGAVKVNTSGRDRIWESVAISAAESPLVGKGPGSVAIPVIKANQSANGHPHNDYLRLLHDFGWIGLGLWLVSYGAILVQAWNNWSWSERFDPVSAHVHEGAVLGLLAVAFMMVTDNVVVYQFAMAPLGILVGASIGLGQARRKLVRQMRPLAWMEGLSEDVSLDVS
jgi:O-antigen ligase